MNTVLRETLLPLPIEFGDSRLLLPHNLGSGDAALAQRAGGVLRAGDAPIHLGPPGPCPSGGVTVFIVLDESASVAATGGNDPLSQRHAEAALAIHHVAAACRCRRDLVSLVPFDDHSPGYVAPQPLTRHGVRRLDRALQRLAKGWGLSSELEPALTRVEAAARSQRRSVAVVVFSDFLLTDAHPSSVMTRLRSFPGYVHAVVLGALPPAALVDEPAIAVTRLTRSSEPGAAARAVFDGLNHYRTNYRKGHTT